MGWNLSHQKVKVNEIDDELSCEGREHTTTKSMQLEAK